MDVTPTTHDLSPTDGPPPKGETLDIARIMNAIPHRYPMLMLDRMVDVVHGQSATGVKNVSVNESFFPGHFPGHPVMPGVLIIESMAQTAAVLVTLSLGPPGRREARLLHDHRGREVPPAGRARRPAPHLRQRRSDSRGNVLEV